MLSKSMINRLASQTSRFRLLCFLFYSLVGDAPANAQASCLGQFEATLPSSCSDESCHYAEVYRWQDDVVLNFSGVRTDFILRQDEENSGTFSHTWDDTCTRMGCFALLALEGHWHSLPSGKCEIRVHFRYHWYHEDAAAPVHYDVESVFHQSDTR